MARLIASFFLMLAGAASASDWRYGSFDNGSWFEAHVTHASGEIAFNCGGRSPGGLPLPQTDEPMVTLDYVLDLTLAHRQLQPVDFSTILPPRDDIIVATRTTGYRLPRALYDELNARGWIQQLAVGDALVSDLVETSALAVDAGGARLGLYDAAGLGPALTRLIAFCDARWAATGVELPGTAVPLVNEIRTQRVDVNPTQALQNSKQSNAQPGAPQAQRTDDGLWRAVQRHIERACERGVRQYNEGFALAANFDGDGVQDYVILWDSIECAGQLVRPFCGASQCAVDVFVSSVYAPGDRPNSVYAPAASVVPGSNGRDLLQLAGRLANCREPDAPPDCLFLWGWVNGDLKRVN